MPIAGVLSVGDSLSNGHGDMAGGVPAQSWGLWLAEAAGVSFTKAGVGGMTSAEVLDRLETLELHRYQIVTLNVGTNDVLRAVPVIAFARQLEAILAKLMPHGEHVVVAELLERIGRPSRDAKTMNEVLKESCAHAGAIALPVSGLYGAQFMKGDAVHFNALGQLELACRAAERLGVSSPVRIAARYRRPKAPLRWRYVLGPKNGAARHLAQGVGRSVMSQRALRATRVSNRGEDRHRA